VGAALGSLFPPLGVVEVVNLLSFAVLGLLVVLARQLSLTLFIALTVLFGLSHGYANGAAGLEGMDVLLYASGVLVAGYVSAALVTAGVHALVERQAWGSIAVRAVGSWILAIGGLYGAYTLLGPFDV
jgi:hydrogenase/urease accessory protein HupE